MIALLVFSVVLFLAVLISELAGRSILSTAVLFLVAGFVAGDGVLNLIRIQPGDPFVEQIAQLALFSVLFTDGMRLSCRELLAAWKLPSRALILGLPLTILGIAALCHFIAGLAWIPSLLIGAILSPTDPIFAAAIVSRPEVPLRVRQMLNVESGLNDGIALPFVLIFIALATDHKPDLPVFGGELLLGVAIGIVIPWLAHKIESSRLFGASGQYQPLFAVSVGLLVLCISTLTHGNLYLAAFSAGVTLATVRGDLLEEFHQFGELIAELLKLGALLVFGALMSPRFLSEVHWTGYLTAALIILLARPAALGLALLGSPLDRLERLTVSWFGPKGFASAIYGLLLFSTAVPDAGHLFHLIAIVIGASIFAHSSTDVPLARWFRRREEAARQNSVTASAAEES